MSIDGNRPGTESARQPAFSRSLAGHEIGSDHTLKVETRVRTPLGLRRSETMSGGHEGKWPRIGPAAHTGPSRLITRRVIIAAPTHTLSDSDSRLAFRVLSKDTLRGVGSL
jgi:hypothetical protein